MPFFSFFLRKHSPDEHVSVTLSLLMTQFFAEGTALLSLVRPPGCLVPLICGCEGLFDGSFLHLPPRAGRRGAGSEGAVAVSPGGIFNKERQL